MTSIEKKIKTFRELHDSKEPLVLYNIWDAGSAKQLDRLGVPALATGSWSVAAAQGYDDGQNIPFEVFISISQRIIAATELPVSLDIEGGFSENNDDLAANIERVTAIGACGINFEDQVVGTDNLYTGEDQAERIATIRATAQGMFINSRTDLFLKSDPNVHKDLLADAIARAKIYHEAGGDGFFVPGLKEPNLIETLCREVTLPVNVMVSSPEDLAAVKPLGVARCSFGPAPYRAAAQVFERRFKELA